MENLIIIGKIGAPHGVRGDVRVLPLTDFPNRFDRLKKVFLSEDVSFEIEQVKYNKQFVILKFKGMDKREDVDLLKGKLLKVLRSEVPALAEGEYYSFDIIGLDVYEENDAYLGKITEILKTGSNDVYVVQNENGQHLLPALKKVVTSIDIAAGKMQVVLQEEMD